VEYTKHWWRTREGEIITDVPENMNLIEWPHGKFFLATDKQADAILDSYYGQTSRG
jgi:hypothetical protein